MIYPQVSAVVLLQTDLGFGLLMTAAPLIFSSHLRMLFS